MCTKEKKNPLLGLELGKPSVTIESPKIFFKGIRQGRVLSSSLFNLYAVKNIQEYYSDAQINETTVNKLRYADDIAM